MDGGDDVQYSNPGQIDLKSQNPEMYGELQNVRDLRDNYRQDSQYALDPMRYNNRMLDDQARNNTSIQNKFSSYGLGGSSAAFGAGAQSDRQTSQQWDDRRLNDMMRSMQVESSLNGQAQGLIGGIQNQYGHMQDQVMNAQQQQNASNQQMWGQIATVGGAIAGTLIAPGVGTAAGASLGASMGGGGGGGSMPMSGGYNAPTVGGANGMYGNSAGGSGYGSGYGWSGY